MSLLPRFRCVGLAVLVLSGACAAEPAPAPPVRVTIRDEKPVVVEALAPLDPVRHINYQPMGAAVAVRTEANQTLHLSHFPTFNIDGRLYQQGQGGRVEFMNRPLPRGKGPGDRAGFMSAYVFGDVRVTATFTLVPTRPAKGQTRRRLDAVLLQYVAENKGTQPHTFGMRVYMDTFVIDNDGCLFAAPTVPGKILDGTVLKDKQVPPYVQLLQRPDLKNPGFVAHLTLDVGPRTDRPDRVVLTRHGAGFGGWDMPAFQANGDSALGVFWEPRAVKPGGKRELVYGYGQGIATGAESEGRVALALGGSFEPGKRFSVSAYVTDPAPGQFLTLELPEGMALLEGKECQPVPAAPGDEASSLVLWRGRVLRTGAFAVRVHSSTGMTQTKLVTVARAGE
jgi:hypothetical protein